MKEGLDAGHVTPQAGKAPLGAAVGKDVEEVHELHMNPARHRKRTWQEYARWCLYYFERSAPGEGSKHPGGALPRQA